MSQSTRPWTVPVGPVTSRGIGSSDSNSTTLTQSNGNGSNGNLGVGANSAAGGGANSNGTMQDLDELHRKYRIMELTRKQSNEESANTLRMQRQQIEKLKKDNDRLKEDLALETRQARQANNMSATAQIAKLQDQGQARERKERIRVVD